MSMAPEPSEKGEKTRPSSPTRPVWVYGALGVSPRQFEKWEKTRQLGRARFIWLYGVLAWGLSTGLIWAVLMAAMQGWGQLPVLLVIAVIGFPIAGYAWGLLMWYFFEWLYLRSQRDKQGGETPGHGQAKGAA
jgi:hypothetical protein